MLVTSQRSLFKSISTDPCRGVDPRQTASIETIVNNDEQPGEPGQKQCQDPGAKLVANPGKPLLVLDVATFQKTQATWAMQALTPKPYILNPKPFYVRGPAFDSHG